jgi:hypothetical protein
MQLRKSFYQNGNLLTVRIIVSSLIIIYSNFEDHLAIFADNFFKDESIEDRERETEMLCAYVGAPLRRLRFKATNQLRGTLMFKCERSMKGSLFSSVDGDCFYLHVFFSLSPEPVAKVQQVSLNVVDGLERKKTTGSDWDLLVEIHCRSFHG